jgi:DNA-binding GntR family transcriptional regulator
VIERRIEVVSIVDRVYEAIRERILTGALVGGERLRQEAIADELGVSRTPLREALRRLASEGLVELEPNRGARVVAVRAGDMLAAYEARLVLEPGVAAIAAGRAGADDLARMRAAIAAHRVATGTRALFDANRAFHLALVGAGANVYLSRFAELLWATRMGGAIYSLQDETPEQVVVDAAEHEAIVAAIAVGAAVEAERLTRAHIATALAGFAARRP